ncbi:MAG: heme-binding domain-containing protein [Acidobacteriaceae bacterium]
MKTTIVFSAVVVLAALGVGSWAAAKYADPPLPSVANPPGSSMEARLHPDQQIADTVHRACYNCHSDQPKVPWYGHLWPSSYFVRNDQMRGMARLNFSEWDRLGPEMSKIRLMDSCTMMQQGKMPPWYYTPAHPESHLDADAVSHFCEWARQQPE